MKNKFLLLFFVILFVFVSAVSCGEISIEPDHIYLSKRIDIDSKTIRTTFVSQNGEMAFCVTEADDTNAVNVTKIKTYDRNSDSFFSTELKPYFDDELDMNILNITATPDGGYFAQTSYSKYIPEKDESEAVYTGFTKYDSDGNAVFFKSADSYPSVAPILRSLNTPNTQPSGQHKIQYQMQTEIYTLFSKSLSDIRSAMILSTRNTTKI